MEAGAFSSWLTEIQGAIAGQHAADVPCDGCTACCTSSQFIHIEPDEFDTLSHIPADLLFPAPRLPTGHVVMGYDEHGHCPMLIDDHCSIYEHRPRTCRTYDCRIFPAAGVDLDDRDKAQIADRARRWRFSHPEPIDRTEHDAVLAAAAYLARHPGVLPDGASGANATRRAVLAVHLYELFLGDEPPPDEVRVELRCRISALGS